MIHAFKTGLQIFLVAASALAVPASFAYAGSISGGGADVGCDSAHDGHEIFVIERIDEPSRGNAYILLLGSALRAFGYEGDVQFMNPELKVVRDMRDGFHVAGVTHEQLLNLKTRSYERIELSVDLRVKNTPVGGVGDYKLTLKTPHGLIDSGEALICQ